MLTWWKDLDRILRGDATRVSALRRGTIELPIGGVSVTVILLGMFYGACMGVFALLGRHGPNYQQAIASMVKVPLLYFLTLAVTFPSLYVFNALVGSRLSAQALLRLLVASLGVTLALLAAFGTIVAFFSVSTTSYPFILLLNVLFFAASGFVGLKYLLQTLHRLSVAQSAPPLPPLAPTVADSPATGADDTPETAFSLPDAGPVASADPAGPLDTIEGRILGQDVKTVFGVWVILFGLVGAQMGWVLRPFVGMPDRPFSWFRGREASFFEGVFHSLRNLFS